MARSRVTLTEAWMDRAQKPGLHWCRQNPGLGCRVGKTGSKSWVFQRSGGNRLTLGRWPDLSLRAARDRAADLSSRGRSQSAATLGDAFDLWAERCLLNAGSHQTVDVRRAQLVKHVGHWWTRSLTSITHADLTKLQLEVGQTSKWAANDVLRHLGTIHRVATQDPWPGENIRSLKITEPPKRRQMGDPVTWWEEVRAADNPSIRAYWLFVALTGLRENDAKTARHSNLRNGWLYIPEPKGGASRAFDLPLSSWAQDAIRMSPTVNDWIFPGNRAGRHIVNPKPHCLRHLCSEHALRHWWRFVAEVEAGAPFPVVQRMMNHRETRGVTDIYGRREIGPEVLNDWAQRIGDAVAKRLGL